MRRAWLFAWLSAVAAGVIACCLAGTTDADAQSVNGWNLGAPVLASYDAGRDSGSDSGADGGGDGGSDSGTDAGQDSGPSDAGNGPLTWPGQCQVYTPSSLVTTDGGFVLGYNDLGVRGNHLDAGAGSAYAPRYVVSALNGYPGATFTATVPDYMQTIGAFDAGGASGTGVSVYTVAKLTVSGENGVVYEQSANAQTNNGFAFWGSFPNLAAEYTGAAVDVVYTPYGSYVVTADVFETTAATSGGSWHHWVGQNKLQAYGSQPGGVFPFAPINVGARGTNPPTLGETFTLVEYVVCSGAQNESQVYPSIAYEETKYGLAPSGSITGTIFVAGDSISSGHQNDVSWIANYLQNNAAPHTIFASQAIVGQTLSSAQSNFATQWDFAVPTTATIPTLTQTGAIIFAGTNDAYNSTTLTPAALYATFQAEVQDAATAGATVVDAITMLSRVAQSPQTQVGFETFREGGPDGGTTGYNGLLRSGVSTCWGVSGITCAIIDAGGDALMGCPSCYLNSTYFADQIHPTNAGSTRIYNLAQPVTSAQGFN